MASPELRLGGERKHRSPEATDAAHYETIRAYEKTQEHLDDSAERAHKARLEAAHEALSSAEHANPPKHEAKHVGATTPSKKHMAAGFDKTMAEAQTHMRTPSKVFSKIIHTPAVEKTSDVIGNTIARPTAMLTGAICAFISTLVLYAIAKYAGFELTGTITLFTFTIGWLLGMCIDILRVFFSRRR